jgi:type VI secretion system protein ImpB
MSGDVGSGDDAGAPTGKPEREDTPIAPRIELRLSHEGEETELPLRLLVMGDFTGRPEPTLVSERTAVSVDRDNFNRVMKEHHVEVDFECDNVLGADGGKLAVHLQLRRLADLEPESVARQVPEVRALLDVRSALTAMKGPLGGEKAFRNIIQRFLDNPETRVRLAAECGVEVSDDQRTRELDERLVARDEALVTSDRERLFELANHPSIVVRRAVAENVSIDVRIIEALLSRWNDAPEEFLCDNPAVRAGWVRDIQPLLLLPSAQSLLAHVDWTDEVARFVSGWERFGSSWMAEAIACAMEMPPAPHERIVESPRRALDRWPRIYGWMLYENVRIDVFHHSTEELDALLEERAEVAPKETHDQQLRHVLAHYPWFWRALARRPECPEDVLATLARAPQLLVRVAVASHAQTPLAVVRDMLDDGDFSVRQAAAHRLGVSCPARASFMYGGEPALVHAALKAFATADLPEAHRTICFRDEAWQRPTWCDRLFQRRAAGPIPRADGVEPALFDPMTSARKIGELARYRSYLGAVIHPNAPDELLRRSVAENAEPVRSAALTQLRARGLAQ